MLLLPRTAFPASVYCFACTVRPAEPDPRRVQARAELLSKTSVSVMDTLVHDSYDYGGRRASVPSAKHPGCRDSAPLINCTQEASLIMAQYLLLLSGIQSMF
jgi:hypothetical protein